MPHCPLPHTYLWRPSVLHLDAQDRDLGMVVILPPRLIIHGPVLLVYPGASGKLSTACSPQHLCPERPPHPRSPHRAEPSFGLISAICHYSPFPTTKLLFGRGRKCPMWPPVPQGLALVPHMALLLLCYTRVWPPRASQHCTCRALCTRGPPFICLLDYYISPPDESGSVTLPEEVLPYRPPH